MGKLSNPKEKLKPAKADDRAWGQRSLQEHEAPRELKHLVEGFEFTWAGNLGGCKVGVQLTTRLLTCLFIHRSTSQP